MRLLRLIIPLGSDFLVPCPHDQARSGIGYSGTFNHEQNLHSELNILFSQKKILKKVGFCAENLKISDQI